MSAKRVFIISGDVLPLPGFPTTGAGLRAWGLGKGLEARGHEVTFSMPALYLDKGISAPKSIADHVWDISGVGRIVRQAQPEVVIFCHWPLVQIPHKLDIPTVLDFHGPHLLEREMQGFGTRAASVHEKINAIRKADFFTCAGEKQRLYFLSWLLAAGINVSENVIASIPVSLWLLPCRRPGCRRAWCTRVRQPGTAGPWQIADRWPISAPKPSSYTATSVMPPLSARHCRA